MMKRYPRVACILRLAALACVLCVASPARAQSPPASQPSVNERLGGLLALDAEFVDHEGGRVKLGDFYDGRRPEIVIFGYHSCPMLCSLIQNAAARALRGVGWTVGREFDVLMISIDPRDGPETAAARRRLVMSQYEGRTLSSAPQAGWHFLTTRDRAVIDEVTASAGYGYAFDATRQQYSHPAVILVTTPSGRVARYLYGIEYEPNDIRIALAEASAGRSISTVDRVLLYCTRYDPASGHYVVVAMRVIQIGSALTLAALCAVLGALWNRERRSRRRELASAPGYDGSTPE